MTEEAKTLLDAVSAGISEADPTPPPTQTPAAGEIDANANAGAADGTTEDSGSPESGAAGADESADDVAASDATKEGADAGTVSDGKQPAASDKQEGEAGKKPEGEQKPPVTPPAEKTPAEKRAAAINDPIDQRLKESTRDRIQFLANEVKTLDTQLQNANSLFDAIDSTGMNPEELAAMLGYARARHHGTAEQKKAAYAFLKEELRAVALELGETDAVDFLADHQDLQDAVANNTISAEHAKEIALARSRAARDTQTNAATTAQNEAQRAHAAGVQAINDTAKALVKRDGQAVFLAKKDVLVATLKPVFAAIPPDQWAATFQRAYDAMPKPAAAAPPVPPPPAPNGQAKTPQPLRPGTPAGGGGKKEPKSMQEAVFAAFDTQE